MNFNDLTIGEARQLVQMFADSTLKSHPYEIGQPYFIRTVTMYFTGRLTMVYDDELVLEDVAWIVDTGRFSESLKSGFDEIEPYPDGQVIIGRGAVIDAHVVAIELPRSAK